MRQELSSTLRDWGKDTEDRVAVDLASWVLSQDD